MRRMTHVATAAFKTICEGYNVLNAAIRRQCGSEVCDKQQRSELAC